MRDCTTSTRVSFGRVEAIDERGHEGTLSRDHLRRSRKVSFTYSSCKSHVSCSKPSEHKVVWPFSSIHKNNNVFYEAASKAMVKDL